VTDIKLLVLGLRRVLCAITCPLILTFDPCRGPIHRRLKKTWVDIPHVGQKGIIQDGVQDGRHTLTQYNSICICLGVMNLVSLPRFLGSRNPIDEIIFRVKKSSR